MKGSIGCHGRGEIVRWGGMRTSYNMWLGKMSAGWELQIQWSNLAFSLNTIIKTKRDLYIWDGEGGRGAS